MASLMWAYPIFCLQLFLLYSQSSAALCSQDQSSALLQFTQLFSFMNQSSFDCDYYAKYSPYCDGSCPSYPKTLSWKEDIDCCSWNGVTCDSVKGHVIGLDLSCGWLHGYIPSNSTLFLLRHLQSLNLAFNNFTLSPISPYFSQFLSLTHLNLSSSNFSGQIPSEISHLSNLVSLDLSSFSYEYSNSLRLGKAVLDGLVQNLTKLTELNLDYVDMSTITPTSFTNLSSSLTLLSLNDCGLQGKFPDKLFHLPDLKLLSLAYNFNFTGRLPKVNWSSRIEYLDVSDMSLYEELSNSIGNLISLRHLNLNNCTLVGSLPTSLDNLTQLTFLSLSYNSFSGLIPSFLSKLRLLRLLSFSENNFVGEFPDIFVNMTQLSHLSLGSNQLMGPLPSDGNEFQNLVYINLFNNSLNGSLPSWLFNLPLLEYMELDYNQLTSSLKDGFQSNSLKFISLYNNRLHGSIPSSIFELVNLTFLDLSSNNLSGSIELYKFAKLKKLEILDLSHNSLIVSTTSKVNSSFHQLRFLLLSACNISEFPNILRRVDQLEHLDLSNNKIHGQIPNWAFTKLKKLEFLSLSHNSVLVSTTFKVNSSFTRLQFLYLSGCNIIEFPNILRRANQLEYLDLSNNKIHGQIPNWVGHIGKDTLNWLNLSCNFLTGIEQLPWKNLEYLDLHSNLIQGTFPIPPPKLRLFSLSNNKLTGKIPLLICNMSAIEVLNFSNNSLSGTIPECLGNISSLHVLDLHMNNFHGNIPGKFAKENHFRTLDFNNNELEGSIPQTLINCRMLEVLDVGNNKINDSFPYWLGNLPKLQVLVLRSNYFYGSVAVSTSHSFSMLKIFDLSNNNFSGFLPTSYFENLKAMMNLDEAKKKLNYIGETYYQDSVVIVIKGFEMKLEKIVTTFTTIDFSNNNFHGEIPKSISKLQSLRLLNLSQNSLTGHIPLSLDNLTALESLDLSSNKLVGKIPSQLASLTFLAILNLSQNQLVGRIPRGNQFETFKNDSYNDNPGLCGFPLSNKCDGDEALPPKSSIFLDEDQNISSWFDWKVIMMGYGFGLLLGLFIGYNFFSTRKPEKFLSMIGGAIQKLRMENTR